MAINNTGALFKSFTFDGTDSRTYGVYITGSAVYDAPEREVEMVSIPNRDGAFALDKGRFQNITVTYPAGIFADTETDFAEAVSDLRNFLCSKRGYCRLTDEYNPNEYRMAIYKSGLEVEPELLRAGEFEITFECQPQRFLTSGETKTTLTSPATVTNPTLFASKPMLEAYGEGDIKINGATITVDNDIIGIIQVHSDSDYMDVNPRSIRFADTYANVGDQICLRTAGYSGGWRLVGGTGTTQYESITVSGTGSAEIKSSRWIRFIGGNAYTYFNYGSADTQTFTVTYTIKLRYNGTLETVTATSTMTIAYDGADRITITVTQTDPTHSTQETVNIKYGITTLDSSQSTLGSPLYIDLDTGDAYKYENDEIVSVNNAVNMPSNLPSLKSGSNIITFDNTFTQVDLIPRWWKI